MSTQNVAVVATHSFADAPSLDIVMVPGGFGTIDQLKNPELLEFIKRANAQSDYATSVCSGSALLARAGVLEGLRATSNKRFFSIAANEGKNVHWVVEARWVEDGRVLTSSGVSAGTDMALGLIARMFGIERARTIASSVEYVWHEDSSNDPFAKFSDWPSKTGTKNN